MDLRSGQSLWMKLGRDCLIRPSLKKSIRCDVLIVGSGITGALIAYHLAEQGLDVVIVDRRQIACGSTPASTALLQYDIDTTLVELRKKLGRKHADAAYKRSRQALSDMVVVIKRLGSNCELARRPSLFLAKTEKDVPLLKAETEVRREIGMEVKYLDGKSLMKRFAIHRPGAILSSVALQLNPWSFTKHLLIAAERRARESSPKPSFCRLPAIICHTDPKTDIVSMQSTSSGPPATKCPSNSPRSKNSAISTAPTSSRLARLPPAGSGPKSADLGNWKFLSLRKNHAPESGHHRRSRRAVPESDEKGCPDSFQNPAIIDRF